MKTNSLFLLFAILCFASCEKMGDRCPDGAVDLGIVMTREDGSTYKIYWAKCNLGASTEEAYGDYYSWGETQPKSVYSIDNYKWFNGSIEKITKYCQNENGKDHCWAGTGSPDNKRKLDPEDDVVRAKLGGKWRLPTREEVAALITKCSWIPATRNGVKGYEVSSMVEGNTNSIFLPLAGFKANDETLKVGQSGEYLSSSLSSNAAYTAFGLCFNYVNIIGDDILRSYGAPVRPVSE